MVEGGIPPTGLVFATCALRERGIGSLLQLLPAEEGQSFPSKPSDPCSLSEAG